MEGEYKLQVFKDLKCSCPLAHLIREFTPVKITGVRLHYSWEHGLQIEAERAQRFCPPDLVQPFGCAGSSSSHNSSLPPPFCILASQELHSVLMLSRGFSLVAHFLQCSWPRWFWSPFGWTPRKWKFKGCHLDQHIQAKNTRLLHMPEWE